MKEIKCFKPLNEWSNITIGEVIEVCNKFPEFTVKFSDGQNVGNLMSWRGSYDIPSIKFGGEFEIAKDVANNLTKGLSETHYGYKGGEYQYCPYEEFYVSHHGGWSNQEKVSHIEVDEQNNTITLQLKVVEY